jgi:hypothetical protein
VRGEDFAYIESKKSVLKGIGKIDRVDTACRWLESAEYTLKTTKEARLKGIKRQYDYGKAVEIGDNILYADDMPDRVSSVDIKRIMIFNAQTVVDAVQQKLKALLGEDKNLFDGEDTKQVEWAAESEAEKQEHHSEAMLGNRNARKQGKTQDEATVGAQNAAVENSQNEAGRPNVDSASEFNEKYNKRVAPQSLPV